MHGPLGCKTPPHAEGCLQMDSAFCRPLRQRSSAISMECQRTWQTFRICCSFAQQYMISTPLKAIYIKLILNSARIPLCTSMFTAEGHEQRQFLMHCLYSMYSSSQKTPSEVQYLRQGTLKTLPVKNYEIEYALQILCMMSNAVF